MEKAKTLEQLRAEKERAETQLAQEQHKLNRLENRKKYLEKGERQKRTHRLCNLGGTIESLAPEVKDLTRTEMTELMEHIFSLSEVQRAVRHMAITHISQANREKELKADGTISSKRHADYTDATAITKRMVAELIQYIEVYPAVKEDGVTNQRVTIHYNCIGAFEVPDRRKIPERDILLETRKGVALSYAPAQIAI